MKKKANRNWSEYNRHLKRHASLDIFISQDLLDNWYYEGRRKRGGIVVYRDNVIEMCLIIREYFGLALRQTQGFIESLFRHMGVCLPVPDYTTLSRRASRLQIDLQAPRVHQDMILALDSTGLSVHRRDQWNREKHGRGDGRYQEKWRKLHVCMDTHSGKVMNATYSLANMNDSTQVPSLLKDIPKYSVDSICADMAYDVMPVRRLLYEKNIRQIIPPNRKARLSKDNRNLRSYGSDILKERDEAVSYIHQNTINGDVSGARANWKKQAGYHARSLVETTMFQIKSHAGTKLTNRTELNRKTQALIKCKIINMLIDA